jgi:hypothetical protein
MTTSEQVKFALAFITQMLGEDVLPYFDQANHQYSVTDMSAILSKFLILQQSIVNLENTFDQKIAQIESPIIREIEVLENCQTIIIPDLDILSHGGVYELEILSHSASSTNSYLKLLINNDISESLYKCQFTSGTTTVSGSQGSYIFLGYMNGNLSCHSISSLFLGNLGFFHICGISGTYTGTGLLSRPFTGFRTQFLQNITSLTIYGDVPNAFAIGTKIILRRKDV